MPAFFVTGKLTSRSVRPPSPPALVPRGPEAGLSTARGEPVAPPVSLRRGACASALLGCVLALAYEQVARWPSHRLSPRHLAAREACRTPHAYEAVASAGATGRFHTLVEGWRMARAVAEKN